MRVRAVSSLLTPGLIALALGLATLQAAIILESAPKRELVASPSPAGVRKRALTPGSHPSDSSKRDGKPTEEHRRPPPHQRGVLPGDPGPRTPRRASA